MSDFQSATAKENVVLSGIPFPVFWSRLHSCSLHFYRIIYKEPGSMNNKADYYFSRLSEKLNELNRLEKNINITTLLRLITFSCAALAFYFSFKSDIVLLPYAGFIFLFAFIALVVRHVRLKNKKDHLTRYNKVLKNELDMLNGKSSVFDDGQIFQSGEGYASDLDVFGTDSLFHRLSRCHTDRGKSKLAQQIEHPLQNPEAIVASQKAIEELAGVPEFNQQLLALLLALEKTEDPSMALKSWSDLPSRFSGKLFFETLRFALPAFTLTLWIYAFSDGNFNPALWCSGLSLMIALSFAKTVQKNHSSISGMNNSLSAYAAIWQHIEQHPFRTEKNQQSKKDLTDAATAMRELAALSERFDRRLNPVVFIALNGTLLYDLHCAIALENWVKKNRQTIESWFEATSEMEARCSMGTWNFNHSHFLLPEPVNEKILQVESIGHPFIPSEKRISNSITIGKTEKIVLITGSNMSGKSTFLRSIGMNLILAQCGMRVCARVFFFHPVQLLSSLRQTDSLRENVSLFHAELIRLQEIQERIRKNGFAMVLIDEMLRGTNSEDKLNGSRKLIERLMEMNCIGLIATHDLALGDMESLHQGKISNYCFESRIENNELIFDYQLRRGIARNKNASFLLRKMNITD